MSFSAQENTERVIVDVEITTWSGTWESEWSRPNEYKEIVQIGAVRIDPQTFEIRDQFEVLVKPSLNPQLSDLFTELTGITQERVESEGLSFPVAFEQFLAFRQDLPIHSYGGRKFGGDTAVFAENMRLNHMPVPEDWPSNAQANLAPWFHENAPETIGNNSGKLVKALGLRNPVGEHSGLADCVSIVESMKHLVSMRKCPNPFGV